MLISIFHTYSVILLKSLFGCITASLRPKWYGQRRCTFTLERNADFGRRAMLLNAENSGIPAAT